MPASRALGFYGVVGAATLGGAALAATRIDPIAMLFWSAVVNGIVAVPIIVAVMLMISNRRGRMMFPLPSWLVLLGWMAAGLMAAAAICCGISWVIRCPRAAACTLTILRLVRPQLFQVGRQLTDGVGDFARVTSVRQRGKHRPHCNIRRDPMRI